MIILLLSFLVAFIPSIIPKVHATDSLTTTEIGAGFGSGTSIVASSAYIPVAGYTYIVVDSCLPYTAIINSITDTDGNTWIRIAREQANFGTGTGASSPISEMWYAVQVTNVASNTVTLTLASSASFCGITLYKVNTPVSLNAFGGTTSDTHLSAILGTVPLLNVKLNTNTFQFQSSTSYIVFNYAFSNTTFGTTNFVSFSPYAPLVSSTAPECAGLQNNIQCGAQETSVVLGSNQVAASSYAVQAKSTTSITNTYSYGLITAVFAAFTVNPPSCQNCGISGGGNTKDTTTTFSLMGNSTYVYLADSPIGGALIQNITTEVSAYTNAGSGKSLDWIYICIYSLPNGVLQSSVPISSSNTLKQQYCQLINTVSTGQTNQFIHVYPNIVISPSTTYGVSIFSRYSGLAIYHTSTTITMYIDTSDYTGTLGIPPTNLGNAVSTNALFLVWTGFQSVVSGTGGTTITTTTTVCASGATCTIDVATITNTVSVVSTSLIYSMQGSNGAVANIQDITAFLPVWVLPLIMGVLFGVIGLLFGGVVGLGMGVMLGIIPLWFAFLLGLAITFLLFKRVI